MATVSLRRSRKSAKSAARGRLHDVGVALTAWLSRPLASFHLILGLCGVLTVVGMIMVLSASSVASTFASHGADAYSTFTKHAMFVALGAIAFWLGLRVPLRTIRNMSTGLMFASVALLLLVLTPVGSSQFGAKGWIVVAGISMQPIEVAKVALALWGAHILVVKSRTVSEWKHRLVPLIPVALVMLALVMAQPDLGGAVSMGIVLVALLWFADAPRGLFGAIIAGALGGFLLLALTASYRLARVMSFLHPGTDSSGQGFQSNQAAYALADGGLFGKGLGQGGSKWQYLPNVEHDFIFALIGEELGLLGCLVIIGLFTLLAVIGLRIAMRNLDPWIRIVSGTVTVWLVAQAAINIGYVVGLLPVTGVTLPLVSYGGTSLVVTMGLFGILANCGRHEPEAVAALRGQGPGRFGKWLRLPAPEPYKVPSKRYSVRQAQGGRRAPRTPEPRAGRTRTPRRDTGRRTTQTRRAPARYGGRRS